MNGRALSWRVAVRMLRATPARSAVIGITIAVPAAVAAAAVMMGVTGDRGLVVAAVVVAAAVVIVAQSSSEPTVVASVRGWHAAGADSLRATRPRRLSLCLLGAGAVAVGGLAGVVTGSRLEPRPAVASTVLLLGVLTLTVLTCAAVPWAVRSASAPTRTRRERLGRRLVAAAVGASLLGLAAVSSTGANTDTSTWLVVPLCAALVATGVVLAVPAVRTGVVGLLQHVRSTRPVAVLAERHRGRFLVRAVVVTSFVVATVASVFGSSVAARDDVVDGAAEEINSRPPVPANVLAVGYRVDQAGIMEALTRYTSAPGTPDASADLGLPRFTDEQIAALQAEFPESTVVSVRHLTGGDTVVSTAFACVLGDCDEAVLADARLDQIYGSQPVGLGPVGLFGERDGITGRLSVPEPEDVLRARLDGAPAPAVTFHGVNTVQIDPATAAGEPTGVRTIFLTQPTPYSAEDSRRLDQIVAGFGATPPPLTVSPFQDSSGFVSRDYGDAPWAPKDASTRWSIAVLAAALALVAAVGTSSIDAIDRWRDNERLEVVGASARQVRGGAALHTWIELGLTALLAVGATLAVLAIGVQAFNADATFPVPFVIPWLQLLVVVVAVPIGGAAVAALVARPLHRRRIERVAPRTTASRVTVASS